MLDVKKVLAKILTKLVALNTDYIVEQGTTGMWTYRKWKSGHYEAWGRYQATGLNLTTASANTYYGTTKTIDLPSWSTYCTVAIGMEISSHSSSVYIYNVETPAGGTTLRIDYRAHVSSTSADCNGMFFVAGTWE